MRQSGCTTARRGSGEEDKVVQQTAAQFEWAAGERPRRYRTRLERSLSDGPTARHDAEEAERQRWLQVLADLVRHSATPMGQLLAAQPGNVEVLGTSKQASTLRSQSSSQQEVPEVAPRDPIPGDYPQSVEHNTEYLRVRLSEPCNRGAHHALVFLNELTGTQTQDRPTSTKLYSVTNRELLATALPGRPSKQAPRMFVSMLRALEKGRDGLGHVPFVRVHAWWMPVQYLATLRFSDHRGVDPGTVVVSVSGLSAVLSWWKADRSRQVSRVAPADNRSMLLPVRAVRDARRVHSPSAARDVPARLSALSARIQLDRSAHKEDAVRNGLRPPEPRLLTPREPSCLQPQHCWASRNRLGLPWRLERPGKRQVRTSIANKDREHAESNSESDPRSRW